MIRSDPSPMDTPSSPLIMLDGVSKSFGGVSAVHDVSMSVADGEIRAIIGPNGAGKSTLFSLIAGQLAIDSGRVEFNGERIDRLAAHRRAKLGIGLVFQQARLFTGMSVLENVAIGAYGWTHAGFVSAMFRGPRHYRDERSAMELARQVIDEVGLQSWTDRLAEGLPLGQQRVLQVARALCGRPTLLLLDEPAAGLRAGEREQLTDLILGLPSTGVTTILVEHDVALVTSVAHRITVLDLGVVIADATPAEVLSDRRVLVAYLGDEVSISTGGHHATGS